MKKIISTSRNLSQNLKQWASSSDKTLHCVCLYLDCSLNTGSVFMFQGHPAQLDIIIFNILAIAQHFHNYYWLFIWMALMHAYHAVCQIKEPLPERQSLSEISTSAETWSWAQRMKPHSSWGRIAKSWSARPGWGQRAAGQVLRSEPHQPPDVRNGRQSTPHISSPRGGKSQHCATKLACIHLSLLLNKYSAGCVLSPRWPPPYPSLD